MEYVYGALLLHKTGQAISEANLTKVIQATGSSVDEAKVKVLVASLKDVDIAKELESATLMASSQATAAPATDKKAEEKKEEKASEAAEGLSALFG